MDIEKAKEIHTSENWGAVCIELDDWIAKEINKLKICRSEELRDVQLTIKVLEKVQNLPKIVIDREDSASDY